MRPSIRSLPNILPKKPLRDAFLAQNTILSAQKAPAGRLSDLQNIRKYVSWYLFRLWYMQYEAFRYKKSFEHSPKPSKHPNYTVVNDRRRADRYKSNLVSQPYSATLGPFMRHVSTICAQILGWHKGHVRIETLLNESVMAVIRFSTTFNAHARKPFLTRRFGSGR